MKIESLSTTKKLKYMLIMFLIFIATVIYAFLGSYDRKYDSCFDSVSGILIDLIKPEILRDFKNGKPISSESLYYFEASSTTNKSDLRIFEKFDIKGMIVPSYMFRRNMHLPLDLMSNAEVTGSVIVSRADIFSRIFTSKYSHNIEIKIEGRSYLIFPSSLKDSIEAQYYNSSCRMT